MVKASVAQGKSVGVVVPTWPVAQNAGGGKGPWGGHDGGGRTHKGLIAERGTGNPHRRRSNIPDRRSSVDHVLLRLRVEGCRAVASALPPASPASGIIDPATYKPRTQFDNTPWRFDMSQNGKRMTAEEFDAWMKARGVRVAKGKIPAAPAAASPGFPGDPLTAPALPVDPLTAPVQPTAPLTAPPAPSEPSTPTGG